MRAILSKVTELDMKEFLETQLEVFKDLLENINIMI